MAKELEKHLTGPDHSNGVGDALAGDIGSRAMDGLEEGREETSGVDVAGGSDADGASAGWSEVGENIAEEVLISA